MRKQSADRLAQMKSGAGVAYGLLDKVVAEARRQGVPFEGFHWLATDDGNATLAKMINVLAEARKPAPQVVVRPDFKVWRTVKLGTGLKDAEAFRKALADGFRVSDWANDILGKPAFTASDTEVEIKLVNLSVADLGFTEATTRREIYQRAQELGLGICPSEVGPQLRLQYKDQPMNEWLIIGMEPIAVSGGDPGVFGVGRDGGGLWLRAYNGRPDNLWDPVDRFVFVLSK